jgi:two-component system CheB/CheR fusion protein
VLIRHIPIAHQSVLHEVLQRHSKLEILQAEDGELIKKDHVYLPPSNMYMTIKNNRLYLRPRIVEDSTGNWSINIFLESLAKDKGRQAIAVILSGGGSDGAKGAFSIKEAGGCVIVQKPESCEHSSMPLNTIRTGIVDHILMPSEMPDAILKHTNAILKTGNMKNNFMETGNK